MSDNYKTEATYKIFKNPQRPARYSAAMYFANGPRERQKLQNKAGVCLVSCLNWLEPLMIRRRSVAHLFVILGAINILKPKAS